MRSQHLSPSVTVAPSISFLLQNTQSAMMTLKNKWLIINISLKTEAMGEPTCSYTAYNDNRYL